ncbi:hypothetical protein AN958_09037 [Leucoagaricus sp. SymC.cos]|nr:hypothetical protein AN958_09037 [Leucoagaricus sp. SymC.cos]
MATERPSSRSERLLRETLERNPHPALTPSPRTHRRSHSHIPESTATSTSMSTEEDDQIYRAAFLYRTAATASSPIRPHYHHHHSQRPSHSSSPTRDYYSHDYSRSRSRAASPRPSSPSPKGSRRQSLHRSPASADGDSQYGTMTSTLQRHNSTPARKRPTTTSLPIDNSTLPLTPHEQVLRARLERVLITGRVVDERERSRERHPYQHHYRQSSDTPGWPWSDPNLASTPPKSSSDHGYSQQYIINPIQSYQEQHYRSRSKTDPLTSPPLPPTFVPRRATMSLTTPAPSSPRLLPHSKPRQYYPPHPQAHRHNSNSSTSTPPLTADASPVLSEPHDQLAGEEEVVNDVRILLTPPPTPPLFGASSGTATATHTPGSNSRRPPGVPMYRCRTGESYSSSTHASPYMYRQEVDGSVEQLDLGLGYPHGTATFNARKASERCRMMEGYVSFAQVEGLGVPPNGVDDDDSGEDGKRRKSDGGDGGEKRGRGLIGTWARKLFVAVQS